MGQAKPAPNQATARKNVFYLLRRCAGSNVEILGCLSQQKVPYTASNNIGFKACILQRPDRLGGVWAPFFKGNAVFSFVYFDKGFDMDTCSARMIGL